MEIEVLMRGGVKSVSVWLGEAFLLHAQPRPHKAKQEAFYYRIKYD